MSEIAQKMVHDVITAFASRNPAEAIEIWCVPCSPHLGISGHLCFSVADASCMECTAKLIRAYANIADEMEEAGCDGAAAKVVLNEVAFYGKVRNSG